MRKITSRAVSVLIIAALITAGMCIYLSRYVENGQDWALYFSRANSGSTGQIIDRNGISLAYFSGVDNLFSPDRETRMANYHVTGDYWGRTGTGILSRYWKDMQEFSLLTGTTRTENSFLVLNIDARLNNKIYEAMSNEVNGCMLVCNYRTGELLAMVSVPTVDPLYAEGDVKEGAFINRCLSAAYTPGSIFKLITAAAAIENIPDIEQRSFYCEKEYKIAGVPIICTSEHYTQNFEQALSNSCNVAFSQIAVMLGQNTMVDYVTKYGLLSSNSLNGISCVKGSYPVDFVGDPELGWSGIGQSTDLVCPYSMLRFICAIANGGILIEPNMLRGTENRSVQLLNSSTADRLKEMMHYNAVNHYAAEENFPGLNICAKTGTAELGDGESHSWFVGFLDDEEHPYAFVTLVERGGFGITVAGSITNQVMQWATQNIEQDVFLQ